MVAQLTGTATHFHNAAITMSRIEAVARKSSTTTMGTSTEVRFTRRAAHHCDATVTASGIAVATIKRTDTQIIWNTM